MPEGDSIAGDVEKLRPILVGEPIVSVYGTARSVRSNVGRLRGATVDGVRSRGKNLLVDFDTGYSIHVHLGMNGRWRLLESRLPVPGSAKVALTTSLRHAVCLGAPTVDVDRTPALDIRLDRLGPDLLAEPVDHEEILRRARLVDQGQPLARVLLDQSVAAGIGNVYKSELAFRAGIDPRTPIGQVGDHELRGIYEDAARLLASNVGPVERTTTGARGRGRNTFVYGGAGLACLRCSTRITMSRIDDRVTFWCPGCQPSPAG